MDAYAVLSTTIPSSDSRVAPSSGEVLQIALNALPVPDESTPWEQIIEYRSDEDSRHKFLDLRNWMSEMARSELTAVEAEQKLEYLISQPISPTAKLKLHIGGIIRAYYQFPYMNRLIHYLLHESSTEAADEVSKFFVAPLLEFQRRLLAEGIKAGEFRNIDPVMFYTSLIGACDHLFFGRHAMSRATGVGPVTDDVCREYIKHMEALICGGMLNHKQEGAEAAG